MARVWFKLIYYIFNIIFVFAAAMLSVENHAFILGMKAEIIARDNSTYTPDPEVLEDITLYKFHDMLYYMIVTMTTVGYGDIYPYTILGQYIFIMIMITFAATIPVTMIEFSKVNSLTSEYSRMSYQKSRGDLKHILLLGNSQPDAINTFLQECFHADHGSLDTDVVIMRNGPPTEEINAILKNNTQFDSRVIYLQGNPLNHEDLMRC